MSEKKYTLRFDKDAESGAYTNAVSVHVTGNEVVLDFAYRMPNVGDQDAILKVISRLNMTHTTAESLLRILSDAVLDYKNKTKK